MVFLGMSHPGKNIIFFNYLLEMVPAKYKVSFVTIIITIENCVIILICASYQYLDNSWRLTEKVALVITGISLIVILFNHEESAMFYYNTKNFNEARRVLANISKFNGIKP
jgi:hypothetical protein